MVRGERMPPTEVGGYKEQIARGAGKNKLDRYMDRGGGDLSGCGANVAKLDKHWG